MPQIPNECKLVYSMTLVDKGELWQMPSKSHGFTPRDQQKLEAGKERASYQLVQAACFMEPASANNLVSSNLVSKKQLPTQR